MFNLFKKKEEKAASPAPALRQIYMGNVGLNDWPRGDVSGTPWSMFVEARNYVVKGKHEEAEKIYRKIIETPELESRHYLQAWLFMRYYLKLQPSAEIAKKVYGVMVEVGTSTGIMSVIAYPDHSARTLHSSGGGSIWEKPDDSLNINIDAMVHAGEKAVNSIPLTVVDILPNQPKKEDDVLICISTPSGIYQGLGTGEFMSKDAYAGPILNAATELLKNLESKRKS